MQYHKACLTYDEQTDLLIDKRGLISDRAFLINRLREVGYYRLSGYWYIFKKCNNPGCDDSRDESFIAGTTFDEIWSLYTFDRQLRLFVLDAIERVEVYFRAQLSYVLAEETGVFGYLDRSNLPRLKNDAYEEFVHHCENEYRRSREPFALHFKRKYGDCHDMPPYWIMVNLMDFGNMLRLYKGASWQIRNRLAKELDVSTRVLESWLVMLNTVRNIAHTTGVFGTGVSAPCLLYLLLTKGRNGIHPIQLEQIER